MGCNILSSTMSPEILDAMRDEVVSTCNRLGIPYRLNKEDRTIQFPREVPDNIASLLKLRAVVVLIREGVITAKMLEEEKQAYDEWVKSGKYQAIIYSKERV